MFSALQIHSRTQGVRLQQSFRQPLASAYGRNIPFYSSIFSIHYGKLSGRFFSGEQGPPRIQFNPQRPNEHYENLELNPGPLATRKRIKEQFQRLAKKWHPDRTDDPQAQERFAAISNSYRILIDTQSRRDYDRWLEQHQLTPANPRSRQSSQEGHVWSRGRSLRPTASSFHDNQAQNYRHVRQETTGSHPSGQSYENKDPLFGQQAAFHRGYVTSPYDPLWQRQREREMEEHARVEMRRKYLQEDQGKFILVTAVTVLLALYTFSQ